MAVVATGVRHVLAVASFVIAGAAVAGPAGERVTFASLDRDGDEAVRIEGVLFVPDGPVPVGGRPAVIGLHGCSGMYAGPGDAKLSERHLVQAETLTKAGYVVLYPDSMRPRGRDGVCTVPVGERTITVGQRRLDAIGALAFLAARSGIDRERIALIGWSHGGSTVLATIAEHDSAIAAWRGRPQAPPFFRTAIAFYPGCTATLRNTRWKPATPLAILIGAADDWTPAAPCEALAERGKAAGWPIDVTTYPDAHHGFDAPSGKLRVWRNVTSGVNPGAGVHLGPEPRARELANAKVSAILRDALAR